MRVETRRHIASWILLAVFLPMLVFSSLHQHHYEQQSIDTECSHCVNHKPHDGHLTMQTFTKHACVLCQILTFTFLIVSVSSVVFTNNEYSKFYNAKVSYSRNLYYGIIRPRAPPVV